MKEINTQKGIFYFVLVPDDAHDLGMETECEVSYRISSGEYKRINTSSLNFSFNVNGILGFTKDITEEQLLVILDNQNGFWMNYIKSNPEKYFQYWFDTSNESLQSLIQANGLDINKNYLILKKL
jgi:hypothetical protein